MQEESIFTRIIKGEIPSHKIYEDDRVLAFLTIQPFSEGHTLVVPKKQIDQIWDLEDQDYDYLWNTAKKIAKHIKSVMDSERIGVVVKGFEVPHAHIHLIPVAHAHTVNFDPYPEPAMANNEDLAKLAEKLRF